ncbi:MAG TPA: dihydrodipicolinate synthase family protein [Ilumatobacteraceae bacterium]|jgi:4-hydroxy-tetrahydrodipicolinate synthase
MKIEGVYVPVVTPFHADESVDEAGFAGAVEFLLDAGVAGVIVGGTTGEYYAMGLDERLAQLELGAKLINSRAQLIAGCNSGATRDVITLANHAKGHGYEAIMLSAPHTSLPRQHELAAHVEAVADACGLPVILYNFPARAGVEYGFECLDLLADNPQVVAIKESSGDFSRFLALRHRYEGRLEVMCGSDDQAFDYMAWGVRSWLDGPGNGMPAEHVVFTNTMLSGNIDLGRRQYAALLPWIWNLEAGSYVQKMKASMAHRGVAVGDARRPLQGLSTADHAGLVAALDESISLFAALPKG